MSRSFWAPPVFAVVAGLLLLLASAAGWVDAVDARDVGGIVVREPTSQSGTTFAPSGVVFGLAALLGGVVLGLVRGRARRVAGWVVGVIGAGAAAAVIRGLLEAGRAEGTLTPAPVFALLSAVVVAAAGLLAWRGPAGPPDASRYRVEGEQPADDEWSAAVDDDAEA